MISKGTQAPRKPSSKHCLPIFQTCHSLSVYQLALHKRGLLLVLSQLLLSLCLCTANTWGSGGGVHFLPQCITLGSNLIVGGTQGACVFFSGGVRWVFRRHSICVLTAHNIRAAYLSQSWKITQTPESMSGINKPRWLRQYIRNCTHCLVSSISCSLWSGACFIFFFFFTWLSSSSTFLYLLDVNKNSWASHAALPGVRYMLSRQSRSGRCCRWNR